MTVFVYIITGCVIAIHGAVRAAWSPCGQSMLASLTPLAERARGNSWRTTIIAFAVGAVLAGAIGGTFWGTLGSLLPSGAWRGYAAAGVIAVSLLVDGTPLRRRMPLTKRQVNEDWMARYRGWAYGFGYGFQLGMGFITLVACAAIYASFAIEFLSHSVWAGAVIGTVFGATKAATLTLTRSATDGNALLQLHSRLLSLESVGQYAVAAAEATVLVVVALVLA